MIGAEPEDTVPGSVSVVVNGMRRALRTPVSVYGLINSLGLDHDAVAVEHNRAIVGRADWSGTSLRDGDRVEIVHFVGGG